MKIYFDDLCAFSKPYGDWNLLLEDYRHDEIDAGRAVPSYAFEALIGILAGWLLKKAGDELWKLGMEYQKSVKSKESEARKEEREEARHREIIEHLSLIVQNSQSAGESHEIASLIELARKSGARITVVLESDAEQDLAPAMRNSLNALAPEKYSVDVEGA